MAYTEIEGRENSKRNSNLDERVCELKKSFYGA